MTRTESCVHGCYESQILKRTIADLRAEVERLREKLGRVADWIRFAANSPSGIVAEVEGGTVFSIDEAAREKEKHD